MGQYLPSSRAFAKLCVVLLISDLRQTGHIDRKFQLAEALNRAMVVRMSGGEVDLVGRLSNGLCGVLTGRESRPNTSL